MAKYAVFITVLMMLAVGSVSAQGTLCVIDVSEVNALLTRAQGLAAGGDPAQALALIERADSALEMLTAPCNLPAVTADTGILVQSTSITQDDGSGGFTIRYPEGWATANVTQGAGGGGLLLGSDSASAQAMSAAQPALEPGQAGMLIVYGSPAVLSNNVIRDTAITLADVARYFTLALGSTYMMQGDPDYILLNDKPAAVIDFYGGSFEGVLIIVEVEPGAAYTAVAAAAPLGELASLLPTAQAVAASIESIES